MRVIEWRAGWLSDPADRLEFLRRKAMQEGRRQGRRGHGAAGVRSPRSRQAARVIVITVTFLAALTSSKTTEVLPRIFPKGPIANRRIWLVQTTPQFDLYSNGLRIEEQYAMSTAPRRYIAFARTARAPMAGAEWRTQPAGIVFHTTESHLVPFAEGQNQSLRRAGEGLLQYVSRRRSYHFVIDRFGRVFRVVRESDYANHAGNSIWADRSWIYINLNQSFFGVAFEARSKSDGIEPAVNPAQGYAGRVLIQMLRARYDIPASNCVAHAQVSVNPVNYGVGYHLDWAANLPFKELGLTDNYKLALPSVALFGFLADSARIENEGLSGGQGMAQGLDAAMAELHSDAAVQGLPLGRYREQLQERYRDAIRALRGKGAYQEYN